jgi:hypothetical protein
MGRRRQACRRLRGRGERAADVLEDHEDLLEDGRHRTDGVD